MNAIFPLNIVRVVSVAFVILTGIAVASPAVAAEDRDVVNESKEAARAIRDYSVEQKDAAVEEAGKLLDSLDERIAVWEEELEENWDDLQQTGRERYEQALKALREERKNLAEWYDGMKDSSRDAWEEAKEGFSEAYTSFVRSWKEKEQEIENEKESTSI